MVEAVRVRSEAWSSRVESAVAGGQRAGQARTHALCTASEYSLRITRQAVWVANVERRSSGRARDELATALT